MPVNFETYLHSKKIDSEAFRLAEPVLWKTWEKEFEQVHPSSFTAQKLFLINPLRRIYHYKAPIAPAQDKTTTAEEKRAIPAIPKIKQPVVPAPANEAEPANPKPVMPKPVFKPKPKIN